MILAVSDVMTADDLKVWTSGLDALFARVAGRFGRVEPRRQARAYVTGLLASVERKNGWQLAEAAGDSAPDRMQRLLSSARSNHPLFSTLLAVSEAEFSVEIGFVGRVGLDDDACQVAELVHHRGDLLSGHAGACAQVA